MDKSYSPGDIESRIYEFWETSGYFRPSGHGHALIDVIPPPNVTGTLTWATRSRTRSWMLSSAIPG